MAKFFLYARKSTDEPDKQILSIEAQIKKAARSGEAENGAENREYSSVLATWDYIGTYFIEVI